MILYLEVKNKIHYYALVSKETPIFCVKSSYQKKNTFYLTKFKFINTKHGSCNHKCV